MISLTFHFNSSSQLHIKLKTLLNSAQISLQIANKRKPHKDKHLTLPKQNSIIYTKQNPELKKQVPLLPT